MFLEYLEQIIAATNIKIFQDERNDIMAFYNKHLNCPTEESQAIMSVRARIDLEQSYVDSMTKYNVTTYNLLKQDVREHLATHNSPNPFEGELLEICKKYMDIVNKTEVQIEKDCFFVTDIQDVPTFLADTLAIAIESNYGLVE